MYHIAQLIKERFSVMEKDVTNKIKTVKVRSKSFTPDGGTPIHYKQLVLEVVLNGNQMEIELKVNKDKALLIESATDRQATDFLDPETKQ